jgi:hypothetical protein
MSSQFFQGGAAGIFAYTLTFKPHMCGVILIFGIDTWQIALFFSLIFFQRFRDEKIPVPLTDTYVSILEG